MILPEPQEIRPQDIARFDILLVPCIDDCPIHVADVVEPTGIGGTEVRAQFSAGDRHDQVADVHIPWAAEITRLGNSAHV